MVLVDAGPLGALRPRTVSLHDQGGNEYAYERAT